MNARFAAILVVLLVVLGGAALLFQRQEAGQRPQGSGDLGQPVLKDLKVADIARIRITEPRGGNAEPKAATLTLERRDDGWTIAERDGFPADVGKVREFVVKMLGLKVGQSEPIGEADRARLNLDASGSKVAFLAADGKSLGEVLVGKKYFRREVENPERAHADGRFVAVPGEAKLAYLVSDPLLQATARTAEWIDRTSFQVEKVKSLEVRFPKGGGWRVERASENGPWKLADAKPGEKLDPSRANAATYVLSLLELADVAPKDAANTGLDAPTLVDATTLDGRSYAIRVGRLEGENYYVSFKSNGEAKPREKMLSAHALLVAKSKLEDTLKPRRDLLEKKDTKK